MPKKKQAAGERQPKRTRFRYWIDGIEPGHEAVAKPSRIRIGGISGRYGERAAKNSTRAPGGQYVEKGVATRGTGCWGQGDDVQQQIAPGGSYKKGVPTKVYELPSGIVADGAP